MAGVPEDSLEQFWDRLPAATLNQCEHFLINGIGKALLGTGIDPLVFETEEHMQLIVVLMTATEEKLKSAAQLLCQWLNLKDENARIYVEAVIPQLSMWIGENERNGNLENIFLYDDYMNIFSVVFQDFQLICQPLGANVAGSMEYDRERVRKALIDAGFGDRLASMDKGLDTMLYKDLSEDGVDVSGGEAQKIAIARALYKNAPFIILDEPTAALDPIAEAEIYSKFNDIAGDKTAIYISHRLSSCKFCDEIAVFHEGKVIQQGTHAELVADVNGKYYELWNAQAPYYTEKTV